MLWRNRYLIIVGAIAGFVGTLIYVRLATPTYATTAKIFLQKTGPAANAAGDGQGGISQGVLDTQCEYLRSAPLLAMAIKDSDAEQMQLFEGIRNKISYLKSHLDIGLASRGTCIQVTLNSSQPEEARQLIDALTGEYRDFETHQQHGTSTTALTMLEQDKTKLDADADAKSKELSAVQLSASSSGGGATVDELDVQRMASLSQALTNAQLASLSAKSTYAQAATAAGIDITDPDWTSKNAPDVNDHDNDPGVAAESEDAARAELFRLRQQKDGLSKQFMPGHPTIVALNARIAELSKSLLAAARRKWMTAVDNERQLQDSYKQQQQQVIGQRNQDATITRLQAELKHDQDQSDKLDKRIGDLTVAMEGSSLEIPMIEPAASSDSPVWPRPFVTVLAGIIAGMLLGSGVGWLWEAAGGEKIAASKGTGSKAMLGLPIFASVPRQSEVSIRSVAWSAHLRPESSIAQSFREVKDGLDAAAADKVGMAPARTILLASPLAGEGRTIAASNLAITLAKSGKRVCLIDSDFRSPALAKIYAMRDDFGFAEILAGSVAGSGDDQSPTPMAELLERGVQRTVIERLDMIPAGGKVENPEQLLNRPSFAEALEELTLKYDHVVLDGPSVLGAADSRIIAAGCDATLLLLSQEASTRKVGEQCRDGLVSVGATIVGVIVNSAPRLAGLHKAIKPPQRSPERLPPTRRALPGGEATREPIRPTSQLPHKSRVS